MQWMRYFAPILGVVVLLVIGLGLLIFMSSDSNDEGNDDPNAKLLRVDYSSSLSSLDPQSVNRSGEIRIVYGLYEGLVIPDPQSSGFLPGVAEKWELDEATNTWTFTLRKDAKWSDGTPVTAEDFRFSWAHGSLYPDFVTKYEKFFNFIKGLKELKKENGIAHKDMMKVYEQLDADDALSSADKRKKKIELGQARIEAALKRFDEKAGVKVIDPHTIQVTMEKYVPYFLDVMAFPTLMPLKASELKAGYQIKDEASGEMVWNINPDSGLLSRKQNWFKPGLNTYNGPYVLSAFSKEKEVKLRPNTHYWDKENLGNDGVDLLFYNDGNLVFQEYEKGELNLIFGAETIEYLPQLKKQTEAGERNDVHGIPIYGTYYLVLNNRPMLLDGRANPMANPKVRKALAMAVNREDITVKIDQLGMPMAHTFVPPGTVKGYESYEGVKFNPEAAQKMLTDAGYPNGEGLPPIELLYNSGGGHKKRMAAVINEWKSTLGLNVTMREITFTDLQNRLQRGDFMVGRAGWLADYVEPSSLLDLLVTGGGNNTSGFSNEEYDRLIMEAKLEPDQNKRMALFSQAEQLAMETYMPVIPVFHYVLYYIYDPNKISGISKQTRAMQIFSKIEVK